MNINTDTVKEVVKRNATLTTLKPYLRKYIYLEYSYKDIVPIALKMLRSQSRYKGNTINDSIKQVLEHVELQFEKDDKFIYPLDVNKTVLSSSSIMGNMTVDYGAFIENGLDQLLERITDKNSEFYFFEAKCVETISEYIDRIIQKISESNLINKEALVNSFSHMKNSPAMTFYEAIQRVLFLNALLWQTGHRLMGLGRMDEYLIDLYQRDISTNKLTKELAKEYLEEMFNILHRNYWFKSDSLPGDTGQIIILGGLEENGDNLCNELTLIILDIFGNKTTPDPKLLLRVNSKTPEIVWDKAVECLLRQTGSPIFANDDVIIDCLCNSGIAREDAYEYATSACWEPAVVGKSFDQNNIDSLNLMEPFCRMIDKCDTGKWDSYDGVIETYQTFLHTYLEQFIKRLETIKWEKDPIISLLSSSCCAQNEDISCGGALYHQYGVTTTGLPNLVDNLLLLKNDVFKGQKYSIKQLENERGNNWGNETFRKEIKNESSYFGRDDDEIITLTNQILELVTKELVEINKGTIPSIKFGLSSPAYVMKAKSLSATYDGRKKDEPLIPHISGMGLAYTEIINFASKLNYSEGRHNGNVVDLFLTATEICNNSDKFKVFLKASVKQGVFELQMNVQDSKTLIAAKKDPERYPNVIVRVWGFSAYFKDLPESYQDVLIQRAIDHEKMIA